MRRAAPLRGAGPLRRYLCGAGIALTAFGLTGIGATALAQSSEGGLLYRFGITQELRFRSNPGLETPSADSDFTSQTRLSFGVISETASQRFAASTSGAFIFGGSSREGLTDPRVDLSYQRVSASSQFDISAYLVGREVDALDFETGFDANGNAFLTSVTGTGRQRQTGATLRLELGRDARVGSVFSYSLTQNSYTDTTDAGLVDNTRQTARVTLRFDLTEVTQLTSSASWSDLDEDGLGGSQSSQLSFRLANERSDGLFDIGLSFNESDTGGTRTTLDVGRRLDFPAAVLTGRLGLTSTDSSSAKLTGRLAWAQELPRGSFEMALDRQVSGDARDNEVLQTQVTLGLTQILTPRLTADMQLGAVNSRLLDAGTDTRSTNLSVGVSYELTPDWAMNVGATHRIQKADGSDRANGTELSLSISRVFDYRP